MENDNLEPDYFDGVIDVRTTKAKELVQSVLKVGQVHSKEAQPSNDWVHVSTIAPVIEKLRDSIEHLEQKAKEAKERVEKIDRLLEILDKCSVCGKTGTERAEMKFPCLSSACPY